MRLAKYLLYQIIVKLYGKLIIRLNNNIGYLIKQNIISKDFVFVFDFNFMNLGDSFFYSLLIYNLNNNGYKIEIFTTKDKKDIYKKISFKNPQNIIYRLNLVDFNQLKKNHFLITSIWSVKLKEIGRINHLLFDCTDTRINMRIAEFINKTVIELLNLDINVFYNSINYNFKKYSNINLINKKFVVFSEEINSGFHRVNFKKINKLLFLLNQFNEDIQLVKVGKFKCNLTLSREYLDFSGKLKISEILDLINNQDCICVIGFDTFFLHFSAVIGKRSGILIRKFSRKYTNYIKNTLFPIYKINNSNINFYD